MARLEDGGFNSNIFQENCLISTLLFIINFRGTAIKHYTNEPSFSLTDALLGQSRVLKFENLSVTSNPTMVGLVTKGNIEPSHKPTQLRLATAYPKSEKYYS